MTVEPRFTPAKADLPTPESLLTALDKRLKTEAQSNAQQAQEAVRRELPSRSGQTRATTRGTARSNRLGYRVTVDNQKGAHVIRFVSGGTGRRGPTGRRIPKGRRGFLRGTGVPSGIGQAPQGSWKRGLGSARKVTDTMQAQMARAWDGVTKGLGG